MFLEKYINVTEIICKHVNIDWSGWAKPVYTGKFWLDL